MTNQCRVAEKGILKMENKYRSNRCQQLIYGKKSEHHHLVRQNSTVATKEVYTTYSILPYQEMKCASAASPLNRVSFFEIILSMHFSYMSNFNKTQNREYRSLSIHQFKYQLKNILSRDILISFHNQKIKLDGILTSTLLYSSYLLTLEFQ